MAALLVLAVGTGAGVWFARDRTVPAGLTAGAIDRTSSRGAVRTTAGDDAIPAPSPVSSARGADARGPNGGARTSDSPPPETVGAQVATTAATPPVAPPPARALPLAPPAKPADRSEVF